MEQVLTIGDIIVRPARPDEMEHAARLRAAMAHEMDRTWDSDHPGWRRRYAEYFRAKQERGGCQMFYAQRSGEIVGMAAFSLLDEYRVAVFGRPRGFVNSVYVVPALRKRGIATALMGAGIGWLRKRGCEIVRLHASEEARTLYASLGFVPGREMELSLGETAVDREH
jgi:GNAT superfamily N-acetyltransferase